MIRIVRLFSVMRNILLVRYEIMFWVSGKQGFVVMILQRILKLRMVSLVMKLEIILIVELEVNFIFFSWVMRMIRSVVIIKVVRMMRLQLLRRSVSIIFRIVLNRRVWKRVWVRKVSFFVLIIGFRSLRRMLIIMFVRRVLIRNFGIIFFYFCGGCGSFWLCSRFFC